MTLFSKLAAPVILCVATLTATAQTNPPAPIYPIPTGSQVSWQKTEMYAFAHLGLNTFNDMEWGFGDTPAATFNPTLMDPDQWVGILKNAGFKGLILTVKHHDGFCLWQTGTTEYSMKNSPYKDGKGDMLREVIDACKKYNLKFGLYLSPWDRNHAQYGKPEYTEYFHKQIHELLTTYCDSMELMEYWFDGANGGDGYYGGARDKRSIDANTYYQYGRAVDTIHRYHPGAMIFGGTEPTIRWVGNEEGWAGQTNWSPYTSFSYWEAICGNPKGQYWLPAECDVSIRPGWFYHAREDQSLKSLATLMDIYYSCVGRNATLLMNFVVAKDGRIPASDSARIMEWRAALDQAFQTNLLVGSPATASSHRGSAYQATSATDGNWDTYWATSDSVTTGTITLPMMGAKPVNRLVIQEYIPLGQRVAKFDVEYADGASWKPIQTQDTMTTVGYKRIIRFATVTTPALRINFTKSKGPLTINNVEAYMAPALMVEPIIARNGEGKVRIKAGDNSAKVYYTTNNTTPTTNSTPYTTPFSLAGKGVVQAIAVDAQLGNQSPVATRTFDILASKFTILPPTTPEAAKMLDGNPNTVYYLPKNTNQVVLDMGTTQTLTAIAYTPDGSRWGSGPIGKYQIWVDKHKVAEGEFSNIKHNPIRQVVEFAPVKGKIIKFVSTATADGSPRASIAELEVITK